MGYAREIFLGAMAGVLALGAGQGLKGQITGGDLLNEAPLTSVPAEMTFKEYQDMNRRLTIGLALSALPVPGMVHFYADEKKTGWRLLGTVALGVVSIVAGVGDGDAGEFPNSDFQLLILNPGAENERRYKKVPTAITGPDTTFQLREIFRETKPAQPLLVVAGVALIGGSILYDFLHGIMIIEQKRDKVRYKYGQLLGNVSLRPDFDLRQGRAGITLSLGL